MQFFYFQFLHITAHHRNSFEPKAMVIMKRTKKIKNKTFAMEAAPAATPPNPNIAATIAIIKKITAQRNILLFV
jgi:hypothetical protein